MSTGDDVLAAEPGEVADVLGEQRISPIGRGRENVSVRPSCQPELGYGNCINALIPKRLRELRRIHLVEEELHRASAAEVS